MYSIPLPDKQEGELDDVNRKIIPRWGLGLFIRSRGDAMWGLFKQPGTIIKKIQTFVNEQEIRKILVKFSPHLAGSMLLVAVMAAGLALWIVPHQQVNLDPALASETASRRFELENESRNTLILIFLGIIGSAAIFIGWRRVRAADKNVEVARQVQVTERFTKAIEQLGAVREGVRREPIFEVRLGGIYALECIARDSARNHWAIMEILAAYIRENAPAPIDEKPLALTWVEAPSTRRENSSDPLQGSPPSAQRVKPRIDIQASLTVLGRREQSYEREKDNRLDLSETNLRWANISKAHLEGADLWGAYLEGAIFWGAHLEGAILWEAHLEGANLGAAHLEGTNLGAAHLERTYFLAAHLEGANLGKATLEGANLGKAHLEGADLWGARLEGANLEEAHLEGANLLGAQLEGANLRAAYLHGANLREAHLQGANLKETEGITQEQIDSASGDKRTQLPVGIERPGNWCEEWNIVYQNA